MSAPDRWVEDDRTSAGVRIAEPSEPFDFDRIHEMLMAVFGGLLYLFGAIGALVALCRYAHPAAGWVFLMVAGLIPSVYSARKAAERRAERKRNVHFRGQQERTGGAFSVPDLG